MQNERDMQDQRQVEKYDYFMDHFNVCQVWIS
jgi:hypothetical protein